MRVVLKDVEGIRFVYLSDKDVVRHELVSRIIRAYENLMSRLKRESQVMAQRKQRRKHNMIY